MTQADEPVSQPVIPPPVSGSQAAPQPVPGPAPSLDEAAPRSGQWTPRRRAFMIAGVALLAVVLTVAGLTVFVLQSKPDSPSEVVDAFLKAARNGDGEKAASWWIDAGPSTPGEKPLRELVRTYVERRSADYERALDDHDWKMKESEAMLPDTKIRIGARVQVTVDDGRVANYLVMGEDEDWGIAYGPEDHIGQRNGEPHPLLDGS